MEKVIIDQESLKRFINEVSPGAYASLTKIDFRALDNASVKPVGVYGSRERIVDLLLEVGSVEPHLFVILLLRIRLCHVTDDPVVRMHFLRAGITL